VFGGQTNPHAPQFCESVSVVVQTPEQFFSSNPPHTHDPLKHISPMLVLHALPNDPQFNGSFLKSGGHGPVAPVAPVHPVQDGQQLSHASHGRNTFRTSHIISSITIVVSRPMMSIFQPSIAIIKTVDSRDDAQKRAKTGDKFVVTPLHGVFTLILLTIKMG
jgi:hypothetical protein